MRLSIRSIALFGTSIAVGLSVLTVTLTGWPWIWQLTLCSICTLTGASFGDDNSQSIGKTVGAVCGFLASVILSGLFMPAIYY